MCSHSCSRVRPSSRAMVRGELRASFRVHALLEAQFCQRFLSKCARFLCSSMCAILQLLGKNSLCVSDFASQACISVHLSCTPLDIATLLLCRCSS
jgi:hypothetical protein